MNGKIPVGVLGATGMVGQRFIQLLNNHPMFEVVSLAASERRVGQKYGESCQWVLAEDMPANIAKMELSPIEPGIPGKLFFSALPASLAKDVEPAFARAGYYVSSNASAFRQTPGVPLLIPDVNAHHIDLIKEQRRLQNWEGLIVCCTNCTISGMVMALKPLHDVFGVRKIFMASMQAMSGAGYPGVSALDINDNVIPFIAGEEEKFEKETRILLGSMKNSQRIEADLVISAHANRVPVIDGHTVCFSVGFDKKPAVAEAIELMRSYRAPEVVRKLPSAPEIPILVRDEPNRPQPRLDRNAGQGMTATVGRVRPCPILDLQMVVVVHNALRGAAGGAVLNAELLAAEGYLK